MATYESSSTFTGPNIGGLQIGQSSGVINFNAAAPSLQHLCALLPRAQTAAFDRSANAIGHDGSQREIYCHPDTRVALREEIRQWADDPHSECIFWLQGMAGTGKSTISRTIAYEFTRKARLGASFFFKRSEKECSSVALLFPTISTQLAIWRPALLPPILAAIETDPDLPRRFMKEQFEKLILGPLESLGSQPSSETILVVIDALDECEGDDDVKAVIYLLKGLKNLQYVRVKVLITSRPEQAVRLGFTKIKGSYQDIVLHEVATPVIEHDITVYLASELAKIYEDHNCSCSKDRLLPHDWPGRAIIQQLVQMSVPLFIFASTICLFIKDPVWSDPADQLRRLLEYQPNSEESELDKLERTYRPILDRLLAGCTERGKRRLLNEFQDVIGPIILLAEPLSIESLSGLLNLPVQIVSRRIESLSSVLLISSGPSPAVRMLHLSFRDFLIDREMQKTNPFWIDEHSIHEKLLKKCLQLMSSGNGLKQDICSLQVPNSSTRDVEPEKVASKLPPCLRYACLYWTYHLQQSGQPVGNSQPVSSFLKTHLLHWLEACSLLGRVSDAITSLTNLLTLIEPNSGVSLLLEDAVRFTVKYRAIIETCPLQLYSGLICFSPATSALRSTFKSCFPPWMIQLPAVDSEWDPHLQTLGNEEMHASAIAFSRDGKMLASVAILIKLWDVTTGTLLQSLADNGVPPIALSSKGSRLAATKDTSIVLSDTSTCVILLELQGHSGSITTLNFTKDDRNIISASKDTTIRIWDSTTGKPSRILNGHRGSVRSVMLSENETLLVSGSSDRTVKIWNMSTGALLRTIYAFTGTVLAVTFARDDIEVASFAEDNFIHYWDISTGKATRSVAIGSGSMATLASFSSDCSKLAVVPEHDAHHNIFCGTIQVFETTTGECLQELLGHKFAIRAIAFSASNTRLGSVSDDRTVQLWSTFGGHFKQVTRAHRRRVSAIRVSDLLEHKVVSASWDGTACEWDAATGELIQKGQLHGDRINNLSVSHNGEWMASASEDSTAKIWNGKEDFILKGHRSGVEIVTFSYDDTKVATGAKDGTVNLWHVNTGTHLRKFETGSSWVKSIAFSHAGTKIAAALDTKEIYIWELDSSDFLQLYSHYSWARLIAFSKDDIHLASASNRGEAGIWELWDTKTGTLLQTVAIDALSREPWFSTNDQCLEIKADFGTISIAPDTNIAIWKDKILLHVLEEWVCLSGKPFLWLPPEYRPTSVATNKDLLVLGHLFGGVTFLRFRKELIPVSNALGTGTT